MNEILQFFGVLFLFIQFWFLVGHFLGRRINKERSFKHWLDDSDDL